MTDKVSKESLDLIAKRKEELKKIVPEVFFEGKLDFNKLKEALGDAVEAPGERYSFSWATKSQSIHLRDKRSKATLVPSKKESVDFDNTNNIFIEGENLEVLKIFQKAYQEKIKMIYIDPPYNTGKDFVYKDDFSDTLKKYLKYTGQINGNGERIATNTEASGRYHSNWLTMMYPRLALARNLLRQDGVILVSIDDNEIHNLRLVLNEIFGEENFIGTYIWKNKAGGGGKQSGNKPGAEIKKKEAFVLDHEYIIVYAKDINQIVRFDERLSEDEIAGYTNPDNDTRGPYKLNNLEMMMPKPISTMYYEMKDPDGIIVKPKGGRLQWRFSKDRTLSGLKDGSVVWARVKSKEDKRGYRYALKSKQYLYNGDDERTKISRSILSGVGLSADGTREIMEIFNQDKTEVPIFSNPKPSTLLKYLVSSVGTENEIILDFFAGSGTIAQAVFEQNIEDDGHRKFILVQLPEPTMDNSEGRKAGYKTIADIGKERIRRVIKNLKEESKQQKLQNNGKRDLGFKVFKLSKSNCFVWDEEEVTDQKTLTKLVEESTKTASKAEAETLLYEVMLREGFALDSKISKVKEGKNEFYQVSDGANRLFACFDGKLDDESVKKLGLEKDDKLVVLDEALTDSQKVNLVRKMRVETI